MVVVAAQALEELGLRQRGGQVGDRCVGLQRAVARPLGVLQRGREVAALGGDRGLEQGDVGVQVGVGVVRHGRDGPARPGRAGRAGRPAGRCRRCPAGPGRPPARSRTSVTSTALERLPRLGVAARRRPSAAACRRSSAARIAPGTPATAAASPNSRAASAGCLQGKRALGRLGQREHRQRRVRARASCSASAMACSARARPSSGAPADRAVAADELQQPDRRRARRRAPGPRRRRGAAGRRPRASWPSLSSALPARRRGTPARRMHPGPAAAHAASAPTVGRHQNLPDRARCRAWAQHALSRAHPAAPPRARNDTARCPGSGVRRCYADDARPGGGIGRRASLRC